MREKDKQTEQRITWIHDRFIVVDAWQTVASVLRLLRQTKVKWVVIWRRHESGSPFWYVLTAVEFTNEVRGSERSQTLEAALHLREHLASALIEDRKPRAINRPLRHVRLESPNRVVGIDSKTRKVKSIGQIANIQPTRVATRKTPEPVRLPYLYASADRGFEVRHQRSARKFRARRFRVVRKAAKKKAAKKKAGGFRRRKTRKYAPAASLRLQPTEQYEVVPIFFATDRAISKNAAEHCTFANRRSDDDRLKYGTCHVSIPKKHKIGELEAPNWFKLEFFKDPEKHVVLLSTQLLKKKQFFASVRQSVAASPDQNAFVFIHGYNVGFEDAASRTAQIAHDLQFRGAPILYSWPSRANPLRYGADEATIDVSALHFRNFLMDVATKTRVRVLHVIAHSMGNRALLDALERFSVRANRPEIHNVVLTAPDIDAQRFQQIAASINSYPSRITLYSSSHDRAIWLSKKFHSYVRAGEAGRNIVVTPGVDTVDASVVDTSLFGLGHSYFAKKRTVLSDIFELIAKNTPPKKRFGLKERKHQNGIYWEFVR